MPFLRWLQWQPQVCCFGALQTANTPQHVYLWPGPPLQSQPLTSLDPLIAVAVAGEMSRCKLQPAAGHICSVDCDGNPVPLSVSTELALSTAGRDRTTRKTESLVAKQQWEDAKLTAPCCVSAVSGQSWTGWVALFLGLKELKRMHVFLMVMLVAKHGHSCSFCNPRHVLWQYFDLEFWLSYLVTLAVLFFQKF